jgi:hypothetical protein
MESETMLSNFFATRVGLVIATTATITIAGQVAALALPSQFASFCGLPLFEETEK